METITNTMVAKQISGMVAKKCWSILWVRKEIYVSDMTKKGYTESSVRSALSRFCKDNYAEKSQEVRGLYLLHDRVVKG